MFVKLILIVSAMFSFVCVRSIENDVQHLSLFSSSRSESITDAESVVTDGRCALPPTTQASINIPFNHKIMNSDVARLKKRTPSHKEQDKQQDLRPGCCG